MWFVNQNFIELYIETDNFRRNTFCINNSQKTRNKTKLPKMTWPSRKIIILKCVGYRMNFKMHWQAFEGDAIKNMRKKLLCARLLIISHRMARLLPTSLFPPNLIKCLTTFLSIFYSQIDCFLLYSIPFAWHVQTEKQILVR